MKTKPRWMSSVIATAKVEQLPPVKRRKKPGRVTDKGVPERA